MSSQLIVTKEDRMKAGSCLFCFNHNYRKVYEVKSDLFSFRICHQCYDKLKRDINKIQGK